MHTEDTIQHNNTDNAIKTNENENESGIENENEIGIEKQDLNIDSQEENFDTNCNVSIHKGVNNLVTKFPFLTLFLNPFVMQYFNYLFSDDTENDDTDKNILRETFAIIKPYFEFFIGGYYQSLHCGVAGFGIFVILFSCNLFYLIIILLMLSLDAFTITVLHDCPLTLLEKKYLQISAASLRQKTIQKLGIVYKCNHLYEAQLEFVINAATITIFKILCIIVLRMLKDTILMQFIYKI